MPYHTFITLHKYEKISYLVVYIFLTVGSIGNNWGFTTVIDIQKNTVNNVDIPKEAL